MNIVIIIIIIKTLLERPLIWHVNFPWGPQINEQTYTQTDKCMYIYKLTIETRKHMSTTVS